MKEPAEVQLARAVEPAMAVDRSRSWPTANTSRRCASLARSYPPVDRFFIDVLVMAEDPQLRQARLALLTHLQERRPPEHRRHLRDCAGQRRARPDSRHYNSLRLERQVDHAMLGVVEWPRKPLRSVPAQAAEPRAQVGPEGRRREARVLLRQRQGRRQPPHEGPARRQRIGPGRDDERRAAGAAGLHDFHRGLHHLLRAEGKDSPGRSIARSTSTSGSSRRPPAPSSDRPTTRCSSRSGRAPSSRCPA